MTVEGHLSAMLSSSSLISSSSYVHCLDTTDKIRPVEGHVERPVERPGVVFSHADLISCGEGRFPFHAVRDPIAWNQVMDGSTIGLRKRSQRMVYVLQL